MPELGVRLQACLDEKLVSHEIRQASNMVHRHSNLEAAINVESFGKTIPVPKLQVRLHPQACHFVCTVHARRSEEPSHWACCQELVRNCEEVRLTSQVIEDAKSLIDRQQKL